MFVSARNVFNGNVEILGGNRRVTLDNLKIVDFSIEYLTIAFEIGFRGRKSLEFELYQPAVIVFSAEYRGGKIYQRIRFGSGVSGTLDKRELKGGEDFLFSTPTYEYLNEIGRLYSSMVDIVDVNVGGIDGIRDYFYTIPFYESFQRYRLTERINQRQFRNPNLLFLLGVCQASSRVTTLPSTPLSLTPSLRKPQFPYQRSNSKVMLMRVDGCHHFQYISCEKSLKYPPTILISTT